MNLQESIIITLLSDIGSKVSGLVPGGISQLDYQLIQELTASGDLWAIQWKYSFLPADKFTQPQEVVDVCDIFSTWDFISSCYNNLSTVNQQALSAMLQKPFNRTFQGFDHTNESKYYQIADILINKLNTFAYMKNDGCKNSHTQLVARYLSMVNKFHSLRRMQGFNFSNPSLNDLAEMINAFNIAI